MTRKAKMIVGLKSEGWIRGWFFYWRAVYKTRTKKHGAGAQPWRHCFAMGRSARFIAYGQHRR